MMDKMNRKSKFSKVIYVAGKFQNNPANKSYIEMMCRRFHEDYSNYLFINGVSEFSHFYEYTTYEEGMDMCIELMLRSADEVWVVGNYEDSIGTWVAIMIAKEYNIPVVYGKDEAV